MSVEINYSKKTYNKLKVNTVLFVDDKFNLKNLKSYITASENSYINELLKNNDLKKKILIFECITKLLSLYCW